MGVNRISTGLGDLGHVTGKIKTQGWSLGKKADAEADAEAWIHRHEERQAKQENARARGELKP